MSSDKGRSLAQLIASKPLAKNKLAAFVHRYEPIVKEVNAWLLAVAISLALLLFTALVLHVSEEFSSGSEPLASVYLNQH